MKQPTQSIPEVFSEDKPKDLPVKKPEKSPTDRFLSTELVTEDNGVVQLTSPRLPEYYNHLSKISLKNTLSKNKVYSMIEKFTPYLVQNLLYLSQHPQASPRDRANASKILLNKILPDLSAEHIKLDSDNLQSLVIVKSGKKNK